MRKLLALFLVNALFFCTIPVPAVYAASKATLDPGISISVDGSVCQLTDAAGNPVYPIMYDSTTYVPCLGYRFYSVKLPSGTVKHILCRSVMIK